MEHDDQQTPREAIPSYVPRTVEIIDRREADAAQPFASPRPRLRSRKRLALILFVVTSVSTFLAGTDPGGGMFQAVNELLVTIEKQPPLEAVPPIFKIFAWNGATFCAAVMSILLAHEMGHYLQARRYRVPATLPYFLPMPISPFGTMGAVILQGAGVADRKQLFDIAISGPLAGLVIAIPVVFFGLQDAQIVQVGPNQQGMLYGDPLILQWMIEAKHGPLREDQHVILNPLLFAGWVGVFITALNLIPIGQLDGGHILYALVGKRAHRVASLLLWGSVAYMVMTRNYSYMLIVILLILMGPRHPPTANDYVPLGNIRIILGWLTLAFIVIGFTPAPIIDMNNRDERPAPQRQLPPPQQPAREAITVDASSNHPPFTENFPTSPFFLTCTVGEQMTDKWVTEL